MMSDATNTVKVIDGVVKILDDGGHVLVTFAGDDMPAWRQFQVDAVKDFDVVVTDSSMPLPISRTIKGHNKRDDKFVPTG